MHTLSYASSHATGWRTVVKISHLRMTVDLFFILLLLLLLSPIPLCFPDYLALYTVSCACKGR